MNWEHPAPVEVSGGRALPRDGTPVLTRPLFGVARRCPAGSTSSEGTPIIRRLWRPGKGVSANKRIEASLRTDPPGVSYNALQGARSKRVSEDRAPPWGFSGTNLGSRFESSGRAVTLQTGIAAVASGHSPSPHSWILGWPGFTETCYAFLERFPLPVPDRDSWLPARRFPTENARRFQAAPRRGFRCSSILGLSFLASYTADSATPPLISVPGCAASQETPAAPPC